MTNCCSHCDVFWWPYMCKPTKGACPECGRGTVKKHEAGSMDADTRYKAAMARREERERSEKRHAEFERFYERREREGLEAALEGIRALPEADARDLPAGAREEAA